MSPDLVEVLRAIADPVRLRMIQMLLDTPEVACTTYEQTFLIGKSTISYHIKTLKAVGLITVRKDGRYYHYTLRRAYIEQYFPSLLDLIRSAPVEVASDESSPPGRLSEAREPEGSAEVSTQAVTRAVVSSS